MKKTGKSAFRLKKSAVNFYKNGQNSLQYSITNYKNQKSAVNPQ